MLNSTHLPAALAALSLCTTPCFAESIDFEDLPAANDSSQTLGEEYAHLGVHFETTDDGATWNGMSDGDPGNWKIDGTEGPTFAGFDGQSYAFAAQFGAPVTEFQLDLARGSGALVLPFFDDFTLVGYRNGQIVESQRVYLSSVNVWQTLTLTEEVDRVFGFGQGLRGLRFAIDNVRWGGGEVPILGVDIDIRPGSDRNPIQLRSRGVVPVVVYGSETFDVDTIDIGTLGFGPNSAPPSHRNGPHYADFDDDGLMDLLLHPRVSETGLIAEDEEACVFGATLDGTQFEGCDLITPLHKGR